MATSDVLNPLYYNLARGSPTYLYQVKATTALRPLYNVDIAFLVVNTAFFIGRFLAVIKLRKRRLPLAWDDYLLIPAYLCTTGILIIGLVMHHYETIGNPPAHRYINPQTENWRLVPLLKCIYAILELLLPAYAFTRYSILALYLRLFSGRLIRMGSYFLIVLITVQWIAYGVATFVQCSPVNHFWNKLTTDGKCIELDTFYRSWTPVNIIADIMIILLPLPKIWKLDVSRTRKSGITLIFGMGAIALAASILREVVFQTHTSTKITPNLTNITVSWLSIEPSLYFITACLPAMQPLFRLLIPASIRHRTNSKIAASRASHPNPSSGSRKRRGAPSSSGIHPGASFTRLVDPADAGIGGASGSATARRGNKEADMSMQESEHGRGAVPMEDLKRVEMGGGIMVQTEIMVTEEERIGEVLGF